MQSGNHDVGILVVRDTIDRRWGRKQNEFLALANDEIRSPLTLLVGNIQMLKR